MERPRSFDFDLEAIAAGNPPGRVDDHRIDALSGSSRQSMRMEPLSAIRMGRVRPSRRCRTEQDFADSPLTFGEGRGL